MYYKFALKDVQKIHFFLQNKFTENIHNCLGIISFKKISFISPKSGDNLCAWLFTEAGQMLGRHIRALSRLVGAQIVYLKVEQPGL